MNKLLTADQRATIMNEVLNGVTDTKVHLVGSPIEACKIGIDAMIKKIEKILNEYTEKPFPAYQLPHRFFRLEHDPDNADKSVRLLMGSFTDKDHVAWFDKTECKRIGQAFTEIAQWLEEQ